MDYTLLFRQSSVEDIDAVYKKLRRKALDRDALRLHWKIARDPFAASAYFHYHSAEVILKAGFFDDGVEPEKLSPKLWNPSWMTTPVNKIIENIKSIEPAKSNSPPVILLSTGAFSPIHDGHISMLEQARHALEKLGRTVVGGYLSPSHDKYVSGKYKKTFSINSAERIHLCQQKVKDSTWLMVDPWEALYNVVDITFTDVIRRLILYVSANIKFQNGFEVIYVFGGDNAAFSRLFIDQGGCVCVTRHGYDSKLSEVIHDPLIKNNPHIVFTGNALPKDISSSLVRSNHPELAKGIYQKPSPDKNIFTLRCDVTWATSPWNYYKSPVFVKSLTRLENSLKSLIRRQQSAAKVIGINLDAQQKYVNQLSNEYPVISLDPCTTADYKVSISRYFDMADGQVKNNTMISRPGAPNISSQIEDIPPGSYYLVDDDIFTGGTINSLISLLPPSIKVVDKISLLNYSLKKRHISRSSLYEVLDLRDLVVGSSDSGLVSSLPNGEICRLPYILPYVSPGSRSSIPHNESYNFSLKVWKLNYIFFKSLGYPILLRNTDTNFQKLMGYIGFKPSAFMVNICLWHINQLKKV